MSHVAEREKWVEAVKEAEQWLVLQKARRKEAEQEVPVKEPCTSTKEPCTSTKEPCAF